uniref:LOW QUALITY PROTEIN: nuclear GTPase SLIP-GC-like n=1 Tax=Semicossyphus pulcher TaxID=241346 RepID=UPI0037E8E0F8
MQSPAKKRQRDTTYSEKFMLSEVKNIMTGVHFKLQHRDNTKLNAFLKEKMGDLETEKRELVGVFGKTGSGKNSLINAIIGEKDLLPSGSVSACTTVMIKVEANMKSLKYEAEIEFITKEEWREDLVLVNFHRDEQDADDYAAGVEMLSALYGEEWRNNSQENLMNDRHFREIPGFINSNKKTLTCESAKELSAKLVKYTRSGSTNKEGKEVNRWFWPLVKCVIVRVPNNDFLQHVTLVDLPGSGDRNKSRDKMWKGVVESCSTVWIVTDINRAAAEKEPWEILESAGSLMGNSGQCQQIHFICTKSDIIEESDDLSAAGVRAAIFKRNMKAKEVVRREFRERNKVKIPVMDDFVREKLKEWGLSEWIDTFRVQGIDEESLYGLDNRDIYDLITLVGPRAKFKKRLELLKGEQNPTIKEHEETADSIQVLATSDTSENGKRRLELQGEPSRTQSPAKKRQRINSLQRDITFSEKSMLSEVKKVMGDVYNKLQHKDKTKLNAFLKGKINDLETEKRELVGVFGKTGAGKSSLINAIIGETDLLPSGSVTACSTVMIKVEANMKSLKYEAEIEFITKEEWKEDLWFLLTFTVNDADRDEQDADDYAAGVEMLSALYGEEWRNSSQENLMNDRHFREIPEFNKSRKKILTCESAEELSAKLVKYTRSGSEDEEGKEVNRWFWPLVKCVIVRVPNNDFLQNVTLVDLPGSGDRNKSRDKMWKGVIQSCSTVWIVTEINRAAAEKESWEILESASSLMGNGGQCQQIHFICTKSDVSGNSAKLSGAGVGAAILKENEKAKKEVWKKFRTLQKVKKHFSDECFEVFTVSSVEFRMKQYLEPDETEVPKLQEFLQKLNDCHSETLNYVSGAHGILSLIQGASCGGVAGERAGVCTDLKNNLSCGLGKVSEAVQEAFDAFENCLIKGVEKSQSSWEGALKSFLRLSRKSGSAFHKTLKCVVVKNGAHKPKKGKQLNLNVELASWLTDSIDEEFRKTFPNESKCGPFNGAINTFSLNTETLIEKYKDVELQLIYLRTEEERLKTKLDKTIRQRKKEIYSSLTTTIEEIMQTCYDKAKEYTGEGTLEKMRDTIKQHVDANKDTMFEEAKEAMLSKLEELKEYILKTLKDTMLESIELSLNTDDKSLPDVKEDLETVTEYYEVLKSIDDASNRNSADQPGPSAAQF